MSKPETSTATDAWLARLLAVQERLVGLEKTGSANALSEPDPGGKERWSRIEVWAHLCEFPSYWLDQLAIVIEGRGTQAVPFGRTKADPVRIAAVASARADELGSYLSCVLEACERLREAMSTMDDAAWAARGTHPTLGEMDVDAILEEFLIGHLEEHAAQLEALHD